jgi:hypothetical protein
MKDNVDNTDKCLHCRKEREANGDKQYLIEFTLTDFLLYIFHFKQALYCEGNEILGHQGPREVPQCSNGVS